MGAGKIGPPGWQDDPSGVGWWGDNPPFHTPTYVLTHRPRPRYPHPIPGVPLPIGHHVIDTLGCRPTRRSATPGIGSTSG